MEKQIIPGSKFLTTPIKIGDTQVDILTEGGPTKGISPTSHTSHFHPSHEAYLIESGTVKLDCNGNEFSLSMGDLFVIRAHTPHRIIGCSSDVARFTLRFLLGSRESTDRILVKNYIHYTPTPSEKSEILDAARHLRTLAGRDLDRFELYRLKSYYGIIFSYILGSFCIDELTGKQEQYSRLTLYSRIENYFIKNCDKQITLESLAAYLNYSKAQTNRILHEYSGGSFSKLLRDARIDTAKKLLTDTKLTISDIALRCGYDTRQGFELMFGKYVGITPHAYREQNAK